jgi:hypothetical protein
MTAFLLLTKVVQESSRQNESKNEVIDLKVFVETILKFSVPGDAFTVYSGRNTGQ